MNKLNKSGIDKLVTYLGEDKCKHVNIGGSDLIEGKFCDYDIKMIADVGVSLNKVYNNLYEAVLDDVEVDNNEDGVETSDIEVDNDNIGGLVKSIMPYLDRYFVTRDEVNDALNNLKAQMIDPNEMIDGLKMQIKRIKNQSRENDEIG